MKNHWLAELVECLLCGVGAVGLASKVYQNRETLGAILADFLGRLGLAKTGSEANGEAKSCGGDSYLQCATQSQQPWQSNCCVEIINSNDKNDTSSTSQ